MRKIALVTGASAGIGREYALALARRKTHHLLLVARRGDRLRDLKSEIQTFWQHQGVDLEVQWLSVDLTVHSERERLVSYVETGEMEIDILVNNAGFGSVGQFARSDLNWQVRMVELNCLAPVHLAQQFLPEMLAKQSGTIINVASTAAFQPMPYMATYGATKSFLLSFSTALWAETHEQGVLVLAVCPGPTASEFHLVCGLEEKMSFLPGMSAGEVVEQSLRAMDGKRPLVINGLFNFALRQLNRVFSVPVSARIVERILRKYQ